MTVFTSLFIALLLLTTMLRLWLAKRHISFVQMHRQQVPDAFAENIALDAHRKAADYSCAKTSLTMLEAIASAAVLAALTLGGGLQELDTFWRQLLESQELSRGALVILCAFTITAIVDLPFEYYRTFTIDEHFGFNKMTPGMFFADLLKQALVGLVLGAPLLFAALWLMQGAGTYWWLYLWLVWAVFNLLVLAIYPTFIAPLFNKFSPLTDESLKSRIEKLMARCGFKAQGLFVMDGSRRSSHGNAYFTGFGANKRVVFFDTLLERLDAEEIEAVLAHELGHFKRRHVIKRIALMFAVSFAGLALLGWLKEADWFYAGLGVTMPSDYMALLLFLLASPILTFLIHPLFAAYSRSNEFEADEYAAQYSSAPHLIRALVKLYRDNASTLTPDPLHSAFYDSHPPAGIRISRLESLAGT